MKWAALGMCALVGAAIATAALRGASDDSLKTIIGEVTTTVTATDVGSPKETAQLYTLVDVKGAFARVGLPLGPREPLRTGGCTVLLADVRATVEVCDHLLQGEVVEALVLESEHRPLSGGAKPIRFTRRNVGVIYLGPRIIGDPKTEQARDIRRIRSALASLSP
jgi:hypothetical protein